MVQKDFESKNIFGPWVQKQFGYHRIWVQKNFGFKQISSPKDFGSKRFLGSKKFKAPQKFGPKNWVKIGSVIAEIFLIWTNVAGTNVAWTNVTISVGIYSRGSQEPTFKV